jgi:hypothetical protein
VITPVTTPVSDWLVVTGPNPTCGDLLKRVSSNWRRTHANITHSVGGSAGASGWSVSVGDNPTSEARPEARDTTRCAAAVIGSVGAKTAVADPDTGLINAVVVTKCGAGAVSCALVEAVCALFAAGAAVEVEVTVSAETVEVGRVVCAASASVDPLRFAVFAVSVDVFGWVSASAVLSVASGATVVLAPPLACTVPSRGSEATVADDLTVSEASEPGAGVGAGVFAAAESC